jgi:hypothetical protein
MHDCFEARSSDVFTQGVVDQGLIAATPALSTIASTCSITSLSSRIVIRVFPGVGATTGPIQGAYLYDACLTAVAIQFVFFVNPEVGCAASFLGSARSIMTAW